MMATGFWIAAAVLVLATLVALGLPLWRGRERSFTGARDVNVALYRQRLAELEEEVRNGLISSEAADEARRELDRQLLDDTEDGNGGRRTGGPAPGVTIAVIVLVPLVAVVSYLQVRPDPALFAAGTSPQADEIQPEQLEVLADRLAQRLAEDPENGAGWLLLARTRVAMQQPGQAVPAFRQALRHQGESPDVLTEYAEVLVQTREPPVWRGEPRELLERALAIDPDHFRALWLAGEAAIEAGEPEEAVTLRRRLLEQVPPDSDPARMLRRNIERLEAQIRDSDS